MVANYVMHYEILDINIISIIYCNVDTMEMNEEITEEIFYQRGYDKGYSVAMEKLSLDFDKVFQQGYDQALRDLKENLKEINEINDSISNDIK